MKLTKRNYIKGTLAKLLAEENMQVIYQPAMHATFDYKLRRLTLPVLNDDIEEDLYNLMIGREAARALYSHDSAERLSPREIEAKLNRSYKKIDPKDAQWGRSLYDITDGIRTERLLKKKYPGLGRDFQSAYADMFGAITKGSTDPFNPQHCSLVDRLNAHFRLGAVANVQFDTNEKKLVEKFEDMVTSEDAEKCAMMLRSYIDKPPSQGGGDGEGEPQESDEDSDGDGQSKKSKKKSNQKNKKDKKNQKSNGKNSDSDESDEESDGDSDGDGSGEGDGEGDESDDDADGDSDGDGEGDSDGEGGEDGDGDADGDADQESDDNESSPGSSSYEREGGRGSESMAGINPSLRNDDITKKLEMALSGNIDNSGKRYDTVNFPEHMDPEEFIVPYSVLHSSMAKGNGRKYGSLSFNKPDSRTKFDDLKDWTSENNPTINAMVIEFERRKRAAMYRRQKISKSGIVDTSRLQYVLYSEDIFRRITVLPEGKNHAMIMIIDWSGSMSRSMSATLDQLMNLVVFCRRRRIPHEVYAFSDGSGFQTNSKFKKMKAMNSPGTLWPGHVKLLQFFSDTMSHSEYNEAMANINQIRLSYAGKTTRDVNTAGMSLNGTPLNHAILVTPFLVERLRERSKAEIMKCIILTDGASNRDLNVLDMNLSHGSYSAVSITDRKTGTARTTEDSMEFTGSLIELSAKRAQCDYVGIFLVGNRSNNKSQFRNMLQNTVGGDASKTIDVSKQYKLMTTNGYAVVESFGFSEYYLMDPNFGGNIGSTRYASDMSTNELSKVLSATMNKKKVNRNLLGRFIDKLAI